MSKNQNIQHIDSTTQWSCNTGSDHNGSHGWFGLGLGVGVKHFKLPNPSPNPNPNPSPNANPSHQQKSPVIRPQC
eukprot:1319967-Amorphochlora_amoeboformis.AAC.1